MEASIGKDPRSALLWRARLRAAGLHLMLSLAVAALAATLVFVLWYPMPYREISGGRELFLLIAAVDVALGPLITLAVFDRRKPSAELRRDVTVVVALQIAALVYGLHVTAEARPAVVALEGDRLRVVRAVDLDDADLARAPTGLGRLSWAGPRFVAARPPSGAERADAIFSGLQGRDVGMRPEFWLPHADTSSAFARAARPLDELARKHLPGDPDLPGVVRSTGVPAADLGYLPILARRNDWSALVDRRTGAVVGYVGIDGH
jgi:hypothetical protein